MNNFHNFHCFWTTLSFGKTQTNISSAFLNKSVRVFSYAQQPLYTQRFPKKKHISHTLGTRTKHTVLQLTESLHGWVGSNPRDHLISTPLAQARTLVSRLIPSFCFSNNCTLGVSPLKTEMHGTFWLYENFPLFPKIKLQYGKGECVSHSSQKLHSRCS